MPYSLEVSPDCKVSITRLCKKNTNLECALRKMISRIIETPHHLKPLKAPLQNKRRAHVLSCFVLIYDIIEENKTVRLLKFSHHDDAY